LWGEILVVGFVVAAATHLVDSFAAMFTTMEHMVSASGTVGVASEIGGAAFASVSTFGSSAVA
jgi:sugar phosphate permease